MERAIARLLDSGAACGFGQWPGELPDLDNAGLYAWWADEAAADTISRRFKAPVAAGIVYVGQAGASNGSGMEPGSTLRSRLGDNHIGGKVRNSTFRLTMAAILLEETADHLTGDRNIGAAGESVLSQWLAAHFRVTVHPFGDRLALGELERLVLDRLDPPLNLRGMPSSPVRLALEARRRVLRDPASGARATMSAPVRARPRQAGRITLHDEIAAILNERGNLWMDTATLADLVNQRGLYAKRDGSMVTAFQIHGRTRNYADMFERQGSHARLR